MTRGGEAGRRVSRPKGEMAGEGDREKKRGSIYIWGAERKWTMKMDVVGEERKGR